MHFKKIAVRLIAAGVVGLLVGMFMDTTVAVEYSSQRIHNLHAQARQTNILLLSGLLFIAGIILFSAAKIKATKEDDATEEEARQRAQAARKAALDASAIKARENLGATAGFLRRHFSSDRLKQRLPIGLIVGASLGMWSEAYRLAPWWIAGSVCVLYAFRRAEPRALATHLLIVHTAAYLVSAGLHSLSFAGRDDISIAELWMYASLYGLPGIVSLVLLFFARRKKPTPST
nr:hypothetical protein [uncultured Roseateles sp.]